ncbi:MAG: hypothetical protein J6J24_03090 [Clostridia bacterium]|nr:hypothetical protein [Clostridia bacterium]
MEKKNENKKEINIQKEDNKKSSKSAIGQKGNVRKNLVENKQQLSKNDKIISRTQKFSSKTNSAKSEKMDKGVGKNTKDEEKLPIIDAVSEKQNIVPEKAVELLINNNTDRPISDIIFCNIIALTAIFLSMFIPVLSLTLPILVFLYFDVGVSSYMLCKERGESCNYEQIFVSLKKYIKIFCVAVIKIFSIALGLIFFIVPGIFMILNYCFTSHIIAENSDLDTKGVLMLSKELVYGYRWNIFFYALLALVSVCASSSLMFFIILIFDSFLYVPSLVYIIFVIAAGILAFITLALPMLQIAVTDYYILAKQNKVREF